jgi:hypothetical protein
MNGHTLVFLFSMLFALLGVIMNSIPAYAIAAGLFAVLILANR